MRLYRPFIFLLLINLIIVSYPSHVVAQEVTHIKATSQETIDEVGRFTGLSKETLQLLAGDSPDLISNLNDTVTAVKIVDLFFKAKDTEALTELFSWQLGNELEELSKKLLPGAMLSFMSAVKVYKASLELIRDYLFIPSMEADIYSRYAAARGGRQDYSYASPEEAYDEATARGSYFPAKQKMYDQLVKSKGYNAEQLGEKTEKYLWGKVDAFWQKRLEAQYQHELMKKSRDKLVSYLWKKRQTEIETLKKMAQELKKNPMRMFLRLPEDLPDGWWVLEMERYREDSFQPPTLHTTKDSASQSFPISDAKEKVIKWDAYYYPDKIWTGRNGENYAEISYLTMYVYISFKSEEYAKTQVQLQTKTPNIYVIDKARNWLYLDEKDNTNGDREVSRLYFSKDKYYVSLHVLQKDWGHHIYDTEVNKKILLHFAEIIYSRI